MSHGKHSTPKASRVPELISVYRIAVIGFGCGGGFLTHAKTIQLKIGAIRMQHEENPIIDAILANSSLSPEEAVKRFEAIRELRRKKAAETFTVPGALQPLLKQALEEKARRK
jgi:hypothetical protein